MTFLNNFKPMALVLLIGLATLTRACSVYAAGSETMTDTGGQFCDRGDNYRSAIFVSNPAEKAIAVKAIARAQTDLGQKIVTPILTTTRFYPASSYRQDYYKGKRLVITRFGPKRQSEAYKKYREACGRDARVRQLWGSAAPFAGS